MEETSAAKKTPKDRKIHCKNLHDYLKTLPPDILDRLYNHPATCLAVFRELPDTAKHYVLRLLFVEQSVPQAVVASWVSQAYSKEHLEVVGVLTELRVWQETSLTGGLTGWILNSTFKKNMKIALLGGGKPWSLSAQMETDTKPRDIPFLDEYAFDRWKCVLHYMVGSQQQQKEGGISADAVRILLHAGLMKRDEDDGGSTCITKEGFQFLLLDTAAQVWYFLLQYLDTVDSRGMDLVSCLAFLFQLSFSTLGKDYSTEGMSESLLVFLQHLREFGLVYQRKRKAGRFYPTRLALDIASGKGSSTSRNSHPGFIVVETNFRVYAYTQDDLQVALLGIFTELLLRMPNLTVGVLTRDSVRQALRSGITARQIIDFLRQHAHPEMMKDPPTLPLTIVDQIQLWENERERFTDSEGVLYNQFLSQSDYSVLRDHAKTLEVLIWNNDQKRTVVVTKEGHEEVRKFWKRFSKGGM
ncbi:general transcription factor IIH subunit 4 [Neocloeon triangulifer]|uniref:general transcription factor IIH subunit 4 n=1 Tax=Neocloeon triangulifer TaxID=2078957 RepID=UPI00286F2C9B|nr:general transcription factor IIH subunit 4 [Neocloeon triangulifer]XP_059481937.1 general transcription factor IIH subunit 4 [Neocloeon triangulifer]